MTNAKTAKRSSIYSDLREIETSKIVRKYMMWSMGAGLIPVPMVDTAVMSGIQLKMLAALSSHYNVPFSKNIGKSFISALVGFSTANTLRGSLFTSLMKALPGIGFVGYVSMPVYAGALTYAIGKIFIQHFESGGSFLTFKPYKVKKHFAELFLKGREIVEEME